MIEKFSFPKMKSPTDFFAQNSLLVRTVGVEPTRDKSHWDLNPARLPIPPRPHTYTLKYYSLIVNHLKMVDIYVFLIYNIYNGIGK